MSGNPDELGAGSPELAEAGTAFTGGEISIDQLRQIQRGETTLEQARGGGNQSDTDADPQPDPQSDENESDTETDQSDSSASSSGGGGGSSSPQAVTNPGGSVGNNQQQQQSQQGIDAPSIDELGELGTEFTDPNSDVSIEDVQRAADRARLDTDGDGTIDDDDAEQLADAGQFEAAQALEEEIDTATGTEGDGTPDDLTAPTVEDVLGGDREVSSAQEADALAEGARQSDEISQERADELLDQAVDDEQGTVTSRDTGVLENQDFADQPGSAAFSEFDIPAPGGASNPSLGERIPTDGELLLDRRGSRGRIESISINGQEVEVSDAGFRAVGPQTEGGGDASTDRLTIDLPEGIDPGVADITIEESFGPNQQRGTETTQIEALLTEDAPTVDDESFEELYEGTQTQDEVQNAISGSEAEAILGEETVDELGGQQEAAAAVSRAVQGQSEPQQQPAPSQQEQQQPAPSGETVIADDGSLVGTENEVTQVGDDAQQQADTSVDGLAGNIGSVTDPDATQPQPLTDAGVAASREIDQAVGRANRRLSGRREAAVENARQEAANRRTDAQGETAAAVNRFGQQQLSAQEEIFGDVPIENPVTGNRVEEDLAGVADEFQDSAETVFANLGRVQPTPVSTGVAGTRTADETTSGIRGAGAEGFIGSINPAEILGDAKEAGEFAVERGDEVGAEIFEPTADLLAGNPVEAETELQQDLTQRGSLIADEAQENPGETAASVIGGAVGGVGAGVGAARAGRGAVRGARSADIDVDLDDVADAAVSGRRSGGSSSSITGRDDILTDGFGPRFRFRQRREPGRDLPDEQEQIEKTEQIERDAEQTEIGDETLDELARRQGVSDDVADVEAAARRRLPPKREFETDAEFRRELERAIRQEEKQRRQAQSEADTRTDTETDTETDAQTQTGIPALTVGAVDGIGDGFGQISQEVEPEIPDADVSQPQQDAEQIAGVGVAGQPSAGAAGQREAILDPEPPEQESPQETTAGVGGIIGGGQQSSLEEELNQGVGEQEAVGIAEEIGIGEEIGFQREQGIQEELGIGEEIGIGEQVGTQIGEEVQISEQTGEQITDTPGGPQITDTPPAPRMPRAPRTPEPPDDGDDDEPFFDDDDEGLFGVQDVEATLDGVFGETNTDTEGGEQGGLFR